MTKGRPLPRRSPTSGEDVTQVASSPQSDSLEHGTQLVPERRCEPRALGGLARHVVAHEPKGRLGACGYRSRCVWPPRLATTSSCEELHVAD
jgi:hypothetical protein